MECSLAGHVHAPGEVPADRGQLGQRRHGGQFGGQLFEKALSPGSDIFTILKSSGDEVLTIGPNTIKFRSTW